MLTRLRQVFTHGKPVLSMYTTAGFPSVGATVAICEEFERAGVAFIELGMPYSDPIADGPTIQRANSVALANGMSVQGVLSLLSEIRKSVRIPIVLMGYFNPVLQFGVERFVKEATEAGADGVIIPDLPLSLYLGQYRTLFEEAGLAVVFLVTSETSEARIRHIDEVSNGFIYLVSSHSVTGSSFRADEQRAAYLRRVRAMGLMNPLVVGFGIDSRGAFVEVSAHADGAIIASAFLRTLFEGGDERLATRRFVQGILGTNEPTEEGR